MYSIKRDIILDVKYSFLRLLQGYFSNQVTYKWDKDIRLTKIIIIDKNAIDLGTDLKRPAIILNRNGFGWSYVTGSQEAINSSHTFLKLQGNAPNATRDDIQKYSDLLQGSMSISILSKSGVEAERLAAMLFTIFTGYKNEIRKDGISKLTNITVSPEQIMKVNSEFELMNVNINLNYYSQHTIQRGEAFNNVTVYLDGEALVESMDFIVNTDGISITFLRTLDITNPNIVSVDYIDAVTLNIVTNETMSTTADPLIYTLTSGGTIQGYYKLLAKIIENIPT